MSSADILNKLSQHLCFTFHQINYSSWHVEAIACTLDSHNPANVHVLEFDDVLLLYSMEMATGQFLCQNENKQCKCDDSTYLRFGLDACKVFLILRVLNKISIALIQRYIVQIAILVLLLQPKIAVS